jgi:hexosaminidase
VKKTTDLQAIVGSYDYWYLDCGRGQWLDFGPAVFSQFYPFLDYCNPLKNWRLIYSYDPLFNLTAEEAALVVGGEIHLWSEQTDAHNVERMLWPRACAAGTTPLLHFSLEVNGGQEKYCGRAVTIPRA